jgi:cold shock CspA family protein
MTVNEIDDDRLSGTVTNFDEARGVGEIHLDDSPAVFPFHCVSIADGSRTIAVGTKVTFDALLKLGRREAGAIRPA